MFSLSPKLSFLIFFSVLVTGAILFFPGEAIGHTGVSSCPSDCVWVDPIRGWVCSDIDTCPSSSHRCSELDTQECRQYHRYYGCYLPSEGGGCKTLNAYTVDNTCDSMCSAGETCVSGSCQVPAAECGDGVVEAGEECDPPGSTDSEICGSAAVRCEGDKTRTCRADCTWGNFSDCSTEGDTCSLDTCELPAGRECGAGIRDITRCSAAGACTVPDTRGCSVGCDSGTCSGGICVALDTISPISLINSPGTGSWQDDPSFSVSVSDSDTGGSGLDTTKCRYGVWDPGVAIWTKWNWLRACNSSFTVSVGSTGDCRAQGASKCQVHVWSFDNANNESAHNFRTYSIDYTPPTVGTITPRDAEVGVAETFYSVVSDSFSGLDNCSFYIDGLNRGFMILSGITASKSYTFFVAGTYDVHALCLDNAGNSKAGTDVTVTATSPDTSPPTVTVSPGPASWTKDTKTAVISCDDGAGVGCEGAAGWRWRTYDDNNLPPPSCPTSNAELPNYVTGNNILVNTHVWFCATAQDLNGNRGYTGTPVEYKVDQEKPTSNISSLIPSNPGDWFNSGFAVQVTDTDTGGSGFFASGGRYHVFDRQGGSWIQTLNDAQRTLSDSRSIAVGSTATNGCSGEGYQTCQVQVFARDQAGNEGNPTVEGKVITVNIDYTPPLVGSISPTSAALNVPEVFSANVSDNISVTNCSLFVDGSDVGAMPLSVSPCGPSGCIASITHALGSDGDHAIYARCSDAANNITSGSPETVFVPYEPGINCYFGYDCLARGLPNNCQAWVAGDGFCYYNSVTSCFPEVVIVCTPYGPPCEYQSRCTLQVGQECTSTGCQSDTQPPTITINTPTNQWYNTNPILDVDFSDNLALDDGFYQIDSFTGTWVSIFTNHSGTSYTTNFSISTAEWNSLSEGTHTIYFKATDDLNNVTGDDGSKSLVIGKDAILPIGSILINSGANYASSTSVTLTLACLDLTTGCSKMRFSNDDITFTVEEDFAASKSWQLTGGDGPKTVYVRFKDGAGNESLSLSDPITLDATGPTSEIMSFSPPIPGYRNGTLATSLTCKDGQMCAFLRAGLGGADFTYTVSVNDTDNPGGSGLDACYIYIRDEVTRISTVRARTCGSATFTVGNTGDCRNQEDDTCIIWVYSQDRAGNFEATIKTMPADERTYATAQKNWFEIGIDWTPPTVQ